MCHSVEAMRTALTFIIIVEVINLVKIIIEFKVYLQGWDFFLTHCQINIYFLPVLHGNAAGKGTFSGGYLRDGATFRCFGCRAAACVFFATPPCRQVAFTTTS